MKPLLRCVTAEVFGTALLVSAVVGSGIMAQRLSMGNEALALWVNTGATVCALVALIAALGPVSGAHFNPVVTLVEGLRAQRPWRHVLAYVVAQCAGAVGGTVLAHAMFGLPLAQISTHPRSEVHLLVSEVVATTGLLIVIHGVGTARPAFAPVAVAAWIGAAYWFTASTSFANPAVTAARAFTDTFAGIRPLDVPGFVCAQLVGGGVAIAVGKALFHPAPALEKT